jgi:TolA-binding protein
VGPNGVFFYGYNEPMPIARAAAPLLLACLLSSCAPKPARPAVSTPVPPAARPVSPQKRAELDREFYKAVSAYMSGDYGIARERLDEILRADPNDRQAQNLRKRIQAAEKAGPGGP